MDEVWKYALGLSVFVIIAKPFIVFIILSRLRYSEYTAFQAAIASGQVSEFAFILLGLGAGAGLIEGRVVSLGGMVGILTIAISSYLILYSDPLYSAFQKLGVLKIFKAKQEPDMEEQHSYAGHVIVVGMNALGREVVKQLSGRGETVLACLLYTSDAADE